LTTRTCLSGPGDIWQAFGVGPSTEAMLRGLNLGREGGESPGNGVRRGERKKTDTKRLDYNKTHVRDEKDARTADRYTAKHVGG